MRVRRREPCQIEVADRLTPDVGALLRGEVRLDAEVHCHLLCAVTGRRIPLSRDELALVAGLDARAWVEVDALAERGPLDAAAIRALADRGGLLSDAGTPGAQALREGEESLRRVGWHPQAAVFHALSEWTDAEGEGGDAETPADRLQQFEDMVRRNGIPPEHFFRAVDETAERVRLPDAALEGALAPLLARRATTRHFDRAATLRLDALAQILYGTFGVLGVAEFLPGVVGVRKSSPSGGSLHPIEPYVLALRVAGLAPGLYHYEGDTHRLALLRRLSDEEATALAISFTSGQHYFADAHALVVHVARAERTFWKYRRHAKAYKVLLLDSGHLSQTLHLLAAQSGLGAFYTAAINDGNIARALELMPTRAFALGINGIGVPHADASWLHLPAVAWSPAPNPPSQPLQEPTA
ncbi:putative peptide maturation dehydrogenase [Coralloluteibacterium thermophilus]|uniref:Peptide maturation dehydrogenase n=1 Tax=Coralloluteibacterium thermophilum TaxID=2707049 RepID=A0ABV9NGC4_9GAMM